MWMFLLQCQQCHAKLGFLVLHALMLHRWVASNPPIIVVPELLSSWWVLHSCICLKLKVTLLFRRKFLDSRWMDGWMDAPSPIERGMAKVQNGLFINHLAEWLWGNI